MNRFAWHIPLGILISIAAHLSIISVISGGIYWPSGPAPQPLPYTPAARSEVIAEEPEIETYPGFQEKPVPLEPKPDPVPPMLLRKPPVPEMKNPEPEVVPLTEPTAILELDIDTEDEPINELSPVALPGIPDLPAQDPFKKRLNTEEYPVLFE